MAATDIQRPDIKLTGGRRQHPRELVEEVQRGRLLDAMVASVAEEGYLATSVNKVLRRAHISRRTFYEIFKDREDCFLAAYDEAADHVLGLIGEACRENGPEPEQRIRAGLRAMFEFAERNPDVARVCVIEVSGAGPIACERRRGTVERLTELVAGTLEERSGSPEEAQLRARVLVGGVYELAYDSIMRGETSSLSSLADRVVDAHFLQPQP